MLTTSLNCEALRYAFFTHVFTITAIEACIPHLVQRKKALSRHKKDDCVLDVGTPSIVLVSDEA